MTQHITQDPDPTSPGKSTKFTVDISGLTLPITFTKTYDPGGQTVQHTVTGSNDKSWTETIPNNAEGGDIEDDTGQNPTFALFINP